MVRRCSRERETRFLSKTNWKSIVKLPITRDFKYFEEEQCCRLAKKRRALAEAQRDTEDDYGRSNI